MSAEVEVVPEEVIDEVVEDEIPEEEMRAGLAELAVETPIPWHGVLAPVEKVSGDNRIFTANAFTYRDFPLPFKAMRKDMAGHDESVVIGNITNAWEEGGLILGEGTFVSTEEAAYFIQLRAENAMRGVSVDVDMAESIIEDVEGNPVDIFNDDIAPDVKLRERLTAGRLASATICAIPAFQEAYFDLGTWEEALASNEECVDCPPEEMLPEEEPVVAAGGWGAPSATLDTAVTAPEAVDAEELVASADVEEFAPGTKDGPGWITDPVPTQRIRNYWVRGKGAAKIKWGVPGDFNRCRSQLAKYITNPEWLAGTCANMHKEALGFWPGGETGGQVATEEAPVTASAEMRPAYTLVDSVDALTASAAAGLVPPKEWFENPNLEALTPLTITDEGRVFGHAAGWGVCHIGLDKCVMAPKSATNYAYFHTGALETDDGLISVGQITMDTGHASLSLSARPAVEHYDNTGTVVADIRCGEDKYGIWMAGQLRPDVTPEQLRKFRAAAISGDWREVGGRSEFVAALAVNVGGFPIPRPGFAASGSRMTALVAAAVVMQDEREHDQDDAITEIVRAAVREVRAEDKRIARAAEIRAQLDKDNPERKAAVLAALGEDI
jgi:hypothetical protein